MAPAAADLVRQVMAALGSTSAADLAETMGWKRGSERLVAKWLAGQNDPSYSYTLEMLERCGWLTISVEAPADELAGRRDREDRLAALEAKVAQLPTAQDLGVGLETLRQAIDRLATADRTEDLPAKPRARSKR